jgi:hypothetical protein
MMRARINAMLAAGPNNLTSTKTGLEHLSPGYVTKAEADLGLQLSRTGVRPDGARRTGARSTMMRKGKMLMREGKMPESNRSFWDCNRADLMWVGHFANRLLACALLVPTAFLLMLSVSVVENRLQTLQVEDKAIAALKTDLDTLRKIQQPTDETKQAIQEREQRLTDRQGQQDSITMQLIWGSQEAREQRAAGNKDWGNAFQQFSNDNNLMIAAAASGVLPCLLSVLLTGDMFALFAVAAGVVIGLFAIIAAKGAKAFLFAGATSQFSELDPYSIVFLAFVIGTYKNGILDLIQSKARALLRTDQLSKPEVVSEKPGEKGSPEPDDKPKEAEPPAKPGDRQGPEGKGGDRRPS